MAIVVDWWIKNKLLIILPKYQYPLFYCDQSFNKLIVEIIIL